MSRVCIVTFPLSESGYTPLSNLSRVLASISQTVYLISGGEALKKLQNSGLRKNIHAIEIVHRESLNPLARILNYILTQLRIVQQVIVTSRRTNVFIFFIGGEDLVIPVILLRLMRKTVAIMPGGVATKGYSIKKDALYRFLSMLTSVNFLLVSRLIVYSPSFVKHAKLERYAGKIAFAHEHSVDFQNFKSKKNYDERLNIIGYFGRLSEEKGVKNLITAIPIVLAQRKDVHFLLCGEGNMLPEVETMVKNNSLNVKFSGWIPHENIPDKLNELKLLIVPSFTEGLPNILLEAMACGTPVVATSVGSIPDVVADGKNGFLLKSNSPESIANKIIELIEKPKLLRQVSETATGWVRENFNQDRAKLLWQKLLDDLTDD